MFNGLIDSTQVQLGLGGSTHLHRMEQDITNEKMEQRLRENKEYNLQVQEYYRQ
jgi:aminoglycoside N3'-acetyltransferase